MFHEAHVAMHFQQHVVHDFLKHHDHVTFVIFNAHVHTRAAHGRKHAHAHNHARSCTQAFHTKIIQPHKPRPHFKIQKAN